MKHAILTSLLYVGIVHAAAFLTVLFVWDVTGIDIIEELIKVL